MTYIVDKIEDLDLEQNKQIEISVMAVVLYDNKLLTTNELIYGKDVLSLPKGHIEKGETLIETAIRECFEETNIIINKDNLIKQLTPYSYEFLTPKADLIKKEVIPFFFRVSDEGNPMPKEERMISVQWMDIDQFLKLCKYENVKNIVNELLNKQ